MSDVTENDQVEDHDDDGLPDPDDRPGYNQELSPALLDSGEQEDKKEDV